MTLCKGCLTKWHFFFRLFVDRRKTTVTRGTAHRYLGPEAIVVQSRDKGGQGEPGATYQGRRSGRAWRWRWGLLFMRPAPLSHLLPESISNTKKERQISGLQDILHGTRAARPERGQFTEGVVKFPANRAEADENRNFACAGFFCLPNIDTLADKRADTGHSGGSQRGLP